MTLVLVTGVSGFVAGACAKALHEKGYRVRGTVRDLHNSAAVRASCSRVHAVR